METFHFGGDEVPGNANLQSPACRKLRMTSTAALKQMFVTRVSEIADRHGVRLQGWGDVFFVTPSQPLSPSALKTKEVYTNAWMSRHPSLQRSHQLANAGYRVSDGWGVLKQHGPFVAFYFYCIIMLISIRYSQYMFYRSRTDYVRMLNVYICCHTNRSE